MQKQVRSNNTAVLAALGLANTSSGQEVDGFQPPFPSLGLHCEASLFEERSIPHEFISSVWQSPQYWHFMRRAEGGRVTASHVVYSVPDAIKALSEWTKKGDECLIEYCEYGEGKGAVYMPAACQVLWLNLVHTVRIPRDGGHRSALMADSIPR